jgi:hypothetical protein
MGFLARFDLERIRSSYGCSTVFETGTGLANGTLELAKFAFEHIYTVEIHSQVAKLARPKIAHDKRIVLLEQSSEEAIRDVVPSMPADTNVLFWLDAHFPGSDFGFASENESTLEISLPLQKELELICSLRSVKNDVFLLDDLRIYEDGPFFNGSIAEGSSLLDSRQRSIAFIKNLLDATHHIIRYYHEEGYIVCLPKSRPMPEPTSIIHEVSLLKRLKRGMLKTWSMA